MPTAQPVDFISAMSEIKRMDIAEFQRLGFLQEANRQFFHPHGLALEITRVTADDEVPAPLYSLALPAAQYERLLAIVIEASGDEDLIARLKHTERYEVGAAYLSGVWDYRDDPEGVIFGDGGTREKAERVQAQRQVHAQARYRMFHGDGAAELPDLNDLDQDDIEPLDWTYPEQADA